jgi:hypothetical protein
MPVSLVKVYFTAGWSMPGCLPDSAALFTTLADAREYLADELDRAADEMFERELETARLEYASEAAYQADYESAHEASASISGSAGLVRSDPDGDIAWSVGQMRAGWSTSEPDDYCYFIEAAEL